MVYNTTTVGRHTAHLTSIYWDVLWEIEYLLYSFVFEYIFYIFFEKKKGNENKREVQGKRSNEDVSIGVSKEIENCVVYMKINLVSSFHFDENVPSLVSVYWVKHNIKLAKYWFRIPALNEFIINICIWVCALSTLFTIKKKFLIHFL